MNAKKNSNATLTFAELRPTPTWLRAGGSRKKPKLTSLAFPNILASQTTVLGQRQTRPAQKLHFRLISSLLVNSVVKARLQLFRLQLLRQLAPLTGEDRQRPCPILPNLFRKGEF